MRGTTRGSSGSGGRTGSRWGVIAAGAVVVLVAFLVVRGREEAKEDPRAPGEASDANVARTARRNPAAPLRAWEEEVVRPAVDNLPATRCWGSVLALDRVTSLADFRAGIAASDPDDELLQTYLRERLTELIGDDPGRALQVLDWAAQSGMPQARLFFEAVRSAGAVQDARVAAKLLDMGERRENAPQLRAGALVALETQHRLSPEGEKRVKAMALSGVADGVSWIATRTLGRVLAEDYQRTGASEPYLSDLHEIARTSGDDAVRLLALEMPTYSNLPADGRTIDKLSEILAHETEKDVREMAVLQMSLTTDPDKALQAMRNAFVAEKDLCVRWAIFRFAVRAAGARSLPVLAEFARVDKRFAQDYDDFHKIIAAGEVDFDRIWMQKPERQPCLADSSSQEGT